MAGEKIKWCANFSIERMLQNIFKGIISATTHILWSRFSWHTSPRFLYCRSQKAGSYQSINQFNQKAGSYQFNQFNSIQSIVHRKQVLINSIPNALLIQIWTALIAILILKYLKFRSRFMWSLSNLVAMLRYNLFTYRDLWAWMDQPFEPPPMTMMQEQLSLNWTAS